MWLSRIDVLAWPTVYFQSSIENNTIIHTPRHSGTHENIGIGRVLDNAQIYSRKSLIKNTWWFSWEFISLLANINCWISRRNYILFNARSYLWWCYLIWRLLMLMQNILIFYLAVKKVDKYTHFYFYYFLIPLNPR